MLSLRGQNLKTLRAVALAIPVDEGGGGQGTSAWRPADYVAPVQRFLEPAWALLFNRPGNYLHQISRHTENRRQYLVLLPPSFVLHSLQIAADRRLVHASLVGKIPAASCYLYLFPLPYLRAKAASRFACRRTPKAELCRSGGWTNGFHVSMLRVCDDRWQQNQTGNGTH